MLNDFPGRRHCRRRDVQGRARDGVLESGGRQRDGCRRSAANGNRKSHAVAGVADFVVAVEAVGDDGHEPDVVATFSILFLQYIDS